MKVTIDVDIVKKEKSRGYGYTERDEVLYKVHIEAKSTAEAEEKIAEVQKAATHLGLVIE